MIERRLNPRFTFRRVYWFYFALIQVSLLYAVASHAGEVVAKAVNSEWQFEIIVLVIMTLLSIVGTLIIKILNKIDKNQSSLFERQNEYNTRLSKLEGEHGMCPACGGKRRD